MNLFFSASIIAGAFSGLLAYAIAHMQGVRNYGGWRWIFILEGIATVVIAFASYWLVPDWPGELQLPLRSLRVRSGHGGGWFTNLGRNR